MDHLSWQHNFVMLYTEYINKVEGYYRFILDLGQWAETRTSRLPPPGFVEEITQSKIEGMRSCTKKAQLQYLTCQTQVKERPQSELELFSRMTDKLVNLFNYMSRMHDSAVGFLTSIENNSPESFFQVSASPDQIDSETFHRVSAPPNLDSSGISQQESAPFSSDDIENYPQVSASPDQNRSDNTKRSKKNTSRTQKPWFPGLGTHKRKQRNPHRFQRN